MGTGYAGGSAAGIVGIEFHTIAIQTVMGVHDVALRTDGRHHDAMLEGDLAFFADGQRGEYMGILFLIQGFHRFLLDDIPGSCRFSGSAVSADRERKEGPEAFLSVFLCAIFVPNIILFNIKRLLMQKKKNTIFLKKESQISNYKGKNSQILDERRNISQNGRASDPE